MPILISGREKHPLILQYLILLVNNMKVGLKIRRLILVTHLRLYAPILLNRILNMLGKKAIL